MAHGIPPSAGHQVLITPRVTLLDSEDGMVRPVPHQPTAPPVEDGRTGWAATPPSPEAPNSTGVTPRQPECPSNCQVSHQSGTVSCNKLQLRHPTRLLASPFVRSLYPSLSYMVGPQNA